MCNVIVSLPLRTEYTTALFAPTGITQMMAFLDACPTSEDKMCRVCCWYLPGNTPWPTRSIQSRTTFDMVLATAIEVPIFSAFSLTRYVIAACCIETYGAFCTWVSLRQYWGSGMTVGLISCTRRRNNTGMYVARDIFAASHERVHFYCCNYSLKWAEVCVISCASDVLPCSLRVWIYVRVCATTGK